MVYHILVASYTDAVWTLAFNPSKPADSALSLSSSLIVGHHPSWLERHPSDPTLVFTGLEQGDGRLLALKYDIGSGLGRIIANVSSGGKDPCTILSSDKELFVGNYSSGTVGVFSLSLSSGTINLKEAQPPLQFSGTGPCAERQEASHPHQIYLVSHQSKSGTAASAEVLVPDLGADTIWRLNKNSDGKWEQKEALVFEKHRGGGPRHIVIHAEIPLPIPADLPPLTMTAAELLLPPPNESFPSPLLYASCRNDTRAHGDLISIFSALPSEDKTGNHQNLTLEGSVQTGLTHLRGFAFFGPDDRYLIAGGVQGGGVKIFERVDGGRGMKEIAHLPARDGGVGLAPTSFLCL
ncbi:hypothetical protein EW145_g4771 [Phellinidium pouzarii]|uniref:Isomerase YbhE n=1 Tax=Phellinidium pouzarii TaxID=167371 RepID=A0A4S4L758_9AGAM|nr:hypothetical protein EW145_g4771 [Phellinidium pouzarii]